MLGSINQPKITLAKELSQIRADEEFPVGARIKKMAFGPATARLGVAPSVLMPTLQEQVRQAEKDWPSYMPASVAAQRMPRMTPTPVMKSWPRLGSPGIWESLKNSIRTNWYWWLGGSVLVAVVIAIVAGGGKKE